MGKIDLNVGERIREVRTDNNLNYSQFARELSFSGINFEHSNIRKYEMGEVLPSSYFYYAIQKIFEINLNWLICGIGDKYMYEPSDLYKYQRNEKILK
ncbi:MAG TPA: helix-turn-helix transcriptional regulator [Ignavibacteria bacterium]|nr:helix-turn-helix transcriptional regulator [Ignavibacteria bacterium]